MLNLFSFSQPAFWQRHGVYKWPQIRHAHRYARMVAPTPINQTSSALTLSAKTVTIRVVPLVKGSPVVSIVCKIAHSAHLDKVTRHGSSVSLAQKQLIVLNLTHATDNLRFALNTCIYGEANATDPVNTPCSTDLDCGPMQGALQDGMSDPSTAQEYSYCSAYDNSFVGSSLSRCSQCLSTGGDDLFYMSNCMFCQFIFKLS